MEQRIHWQKLDTIVVLGLGQSGRSVVRFLVGEKSPLPAHCEIHTFDSREQPPGLDEVKQLLGEERVIAGRMAA